MGKIVKLTAALLAGCFLAGFSLDNAIIPKDEILSGGPPKDGIPAILTPQFISSDKAGFIEDDDQVIGIIVGTTARAYPISILNWHEVVNDEINGVPAVVTF
jgi:hypothetical protein